MARTIKVKAIGQPTKITIRSAANWTSPRYSGLIVPRSGRQWPHTSDRGVKTLQELGDALDGQHRRRQRDDRLERIDGWSPGARVGHLPDRPRKAGLLEARQEDEHHPR